MINRIKKIIFFLISFAISGMLSAQDLHFSQFFNAPLTTNPGNTGVFNGDIRAYTLYRMQWFTVTTPYKTITLGVDAPIFKKRMPDDDFFAAGININNDNLGNINYMINSVNGSLSFTKYLGGRNEHDITIGYQVGYGFITANTKKLTWDSQYDMTSQTYYPGSGFDESYGGGGKGYLDMSTGLVWNFTSSDVFRSALGFSYHHFLSPNISINGGEDRLLPKIGVQWNTAIRLNETSNVTFLPSIMAAQQGTSLLLNGGTCVRYVLGEGSRYTNYRSYKAVYIGGFYRFRDAAYMTFRFDVANFAFALAYDVNISKLTPASKTVGGVEFMLQYKGTVGKFRRIKRHSERFL
ncbi:MAG TPA: PorP/SprF family type IX secretion system membrane protein [Bacteroidia bacterium]|jgi:type IX secretion system PorP/SprF family membrane protein|nr:PorP/SprF family type IX secretion system membrane protein [Bacteroidia bacterium]